MMTLMWIMVGAMKGKGPRWLVEWDLVRLLLMRRCLPLLRWVGWRMVRKRRGWWGRLVEIGGLSLALGTSFSTVFLWGELPCMIWWQFMRVTLPLFRDWGAHWFCCPCAGRLCRRFQFRSPWGFCSIFWRGCWWSPSLLGLPPIWWCFEVFEKYRFGRLGFRNVLVVSYTRNFLHGVIQ